MRIWILIPCTGRRQAFPSRLSLIWIGSIIMLVYIVYSLLFQTFNFNTSKYSRIMQDKLTYGIVIDCGSSGSRVFVYYWLPHDGQPHKLLKIHLLKDSGNKPIVMKLEPGLSSFANNPQGVGNYLFPLLNFAARHIPETKVAETPLYILATAGLRLLDERLQKQIMDAVHINISSKYSFLFPRTHVEVISGKQEGIFSWISVNYALGKLDHNFSNTADKLIAVEVSGIEKLHIRKRTVGVLDLGGASLQMAFEVPNSIYSIKNQDNIADLDLGCTSDSLHFKYRLFVATYLGYGSNEAREKYKSHLTNIALSKTNESEKDDYSSVQLEDACLLRGKSDKHFKDGRKITIVGVGNFSKCVASLTPLVKNTNCTHKKCSIDGNILPKINFKNSEFYGFSEFYYTMNDILEIGGKYDHFLFKKRAEEYCHTHWSQVEEWKNESKHGEADDNRYLLQCFKSAWLIQVLHEGLQFPYFYKHLTSLHSINGNEVHWSLGAIIVKTKYFPLRDIENYMATQHAQTHSKNLDTILNPFINLIQSPLTFVGITLFILLIVYIISLGIFNKKFDARDDYLPSYQYMSNLDSELQMVRSRSTTFLVSN